MVHASVRDSLRVAAHCGVVGTRCLMLLLSVLSVWGGRALALDLLWRAVLARVDKVLCMRRGLKYVLLLRRPSNLGKLTAKFKRLITTNRLELTTRTD